MNIRLLNRELICL